MPDLKPTPGGRPLDPTVRKKLEAAFGADLSNVRIHTDSSARAPSSSVGARAFTHGNDIFFQAGAYQPNTDYGKKLLAHEVAHVLQQRDDKRVNPPAEDPVAEQKAKRLAEEAIKKLR